LEVIKRALLRNTAAKDNMMCNSSRGRIQQQLLVVCFDTDEEEKKKKVPHCMWLHHSPIITHDKDEKMLDIWQRGVRRSIEHLAKQVVSAKQ
jgi:hypothetical protein